MKAPRLFAFICLAATLVSACAPATPTLEPVIVSIYAAPAARPWLDEAFQCAGQAGAVISITADPAQADLSMRIGEPPGLNTSSFQIDTEEILVFASQESPVADLTKDGTRDLFSGRGDPSVEVWVYSSNEDVQRAFDQLVMNGRTVTSLARVAASPQQMADTLNGEKNGLGILPGHWKAGSLREVFSAGTVPVLAITPIEPSGAIATLIDCLQK